MRAHRPAVATVSLGLLALLVSCTSTAPAQPTTEPAVSRIATSTAVSTRPPVAVASSHARPPRTSSARAHTSSKPRPVTTAAPPTAPAPTPATATATGTGSARRRVVVIDPGHSPTIQSVDPATGLVDSDYENEPEMRDVFAVAVLVRNQLEADGYRVVMTKNTATDRISLGQRAAVANRVHAAIAISIHDQAGSSGGIQFDQGNNIVYYQSVGGYRETPNGTRVTFTRRAVAAKSEQYGYIFQAQRAAAEGHAVRLQANVGYDLGSRGLAAGDMWMVQLLAHVPWIYNEAGGNSVGRSGLNATDEHRYAHGLVAGIERCVPVAR
jgi:N-acetylmuramoyl-L-alanine amidase